MYKLVDLTNLRWSTTRSNGVSYGAYYKATSMEKGRKVYYKCSNYYQGQVVFGDESVYEVICSRLLNHLGLRCVDYKLVYATVVVNGKSMNTHVCRSLDYSRGCDSRMTFEDLHGMVGGSVDDLITRFKFKSDILNMIVADFITLQRDRHGGNIEVLFKNNRYRLAPLFDNGLTFLSPYPSKISGSCAKFDSLYDYPVNNYIGVRSLYSNLGYIDTPVPVNKLRRESRGHIFYNLSDVLRADYLDKIWEIITYRYMFLRKRNLIIERQ